MEDIKQITLSVATSRKSTAWRQQTYSWADLCQKCRTPRRTGETYEVYLGMNRDSQGDIKDVGGFMAGLLSCGRRKRCYVTGRTAVTLDIDDTGGESAESIWSRITAKLPGVAAIAYSTHKHCDAKPRLRVVVPLVRQVNADTYEPVARMLAKQLGLIEICDPTTFDPARMFYWPSASQDGDYFERDCDGRAIEPTEMLAHYTEKPWNDESGWPRVPGEEGKVQERRNPERRGRDLADPLDKPGIVGAFCRAYSPIEVGLDELLGDVYQRGLHGRYTYIGATTTNGLVLYDLNGDGVNRWAYSNHSTDPAAGEEHNIFDLVRVHRFGGHDDGSRATGENLPSYKAMVEFAMADARTKRQCVADRKKMFDGVDDEPESEMKALHDGAPPAETPPESTETDDWQSLLDVDKNGRVKPTSDNFVRILDNDPGLKGLIRKNLMTGFCEKTRPTPWHSKEGTWADDDDANLRVYIERRYGARASDRLADSVAYVYTRDSYHPVRDYLNGLVKYEGEDFSELERVFTDYLGAEDTPLTRQMARKAFTAAVARVMRPGCKFDYCVTLIGLEGLGKSTFLKIMAGDKYFTDSISTFDGKDVLEQLIGIWLAELSELAAVSRVGIDKVKQILSSTDDKFRPAYGRRVESHPRQCVFFATTNEDSPLRGDTGNRRFWPVPCGAVPVTKTIEDLAERRDTLWAMALALFRRGEKLYLDKDMEMEVRSRQKARNIDNEDPIPLLLEDFLEAEVPADWRTWSLQRRRGFFLGNESQIITEPRICFSACEFICERLGKDMSDPNYKYLAQKVSTAMKEMKGWKYMGENKSGHAANVYGRQRYWLRER